MTTIAVRISSKQRETDEIAVFELVSADGAALPEFSPGAHIDVHVAGLVRQYSLCNGPQDSDRYLIAVKREPQSRGGSRAMHELQAGDRLEISAPRNHFPLDPAPGPKLFLAAGIGITPLLSMTRHLLARGLPFELQVFTRSREHTAFRELLAGAEFRGQASFHYGLDAEALRAHLQALLCRRAEGAQLYLCGPRPFMDLVVATAAALSWPSEAVHLEYFSADPGLEDAPRRAFRVKLARSGASYDVPEDKSIVQALAEQGVDIATACEQGICGTCLTGVVDGTPDHRDSFLSDEEKRAGKQIMPCVSRAKSPLLVLDL